MTPIILLTGFLGSGKTTLLSRLLRTPDFSRTAVIINEFGEIGLDHELVEAGEENMVELTNGCLCCRVHSDLALTLQSLSERRKAGRAAFDRVVIETSGLADPVPILHEIATNPAITAEFAVERVITTVDVLGGSEVTGRYVEARRQIAMADTLLLTKGDLADAGEQAVIHQVLDKLNHWAPRIDWQLLQDQGLPAVGADAATGDIDPHPHPRHPHDHPVADDGQGAHSHAQVYDCVCIVRAAPLRASTLPLFLEALAAHEGERLLRVKGLIHIAEMLDCPMVIHGALHVYHQPSWLERWPSDDRRTRIVLIGHDLSEPWCRALLEALEAEVEAVTLSLASRRAMMRPLDAAPGSGLLDRMGDGLRPRHERVAD